MLDFVKLQSESLAYVEISEAYSLLRLKTADSLKKLLHIVYCMEQRNADTSRQSSRFGAPVRQQRFLLNKRVLTQRNDSFLKTN